MVSWRGNDRTKSAFTVSIEVISLGSSARLVSERNCRKTRPSDRSCDLEGVRTMGSEERTLLPRRNPVAEVSISDMMPGSSSKRLA